MRYGSIDSSPNMSPEKPKRTTQYLATLASTMGSVGLGAGLAWTSPSIPLLREDCLTKNWTNCAFQNQTQFLTEGQVQWVSGIFALGAMASALLTGLLISSIGRKWTIITLCLPMALGWFCLLLPLWIENTNYLFYIGRFLTGLGCGGFALAPPLYLGEIAETSIRGALGNTVQFMILLGMVIVSAFGIEHSLNVKLITGLCLVPPILGTILMLFMPETPFYLVSKEKESEAMKALVWLRGTPNVQDELKEIKRAFEDQKKIGTVSFKHFFANKVYLKPLLLMATLMFFQQFSGINAVNFNLVSIFQDVGSDLDEGLQGFIITIAQWIGCGMTVFVVDKLGRKTLLCISATIMCISIFTMGTFFYLKENQVPDSNSTTLSLQLTESQVKDLAWLPLASLVAYIIGFSWGFGPIPWTINPEMFPQEVKDKGTSIITQFNWFCTFLVTYFFADLRASLKDSGTYFFFGSFAFLSILFILKMLPETKGKSNEDMRHYFASNSSN